MDMFYLMHRDEKIAAFTIDRDAVLSFKINEETKEHLPFSVNDLKSFSVWLNERAIPAKRYRYLNSNVSRLKFLLDNNSLSLTDNYWTCLVSLSQKWDDANFYNNSFFSTIILDSFEEVKTIADKTNFIPSASLKGDLAKKWIIDSYGIRFLVKGSYLTNALQSVSEVLATAMYDKCDIEFVEYSLLEISCNNEKKIGCKCKNFTDIDSEFIPAIDIVSIGKKPNDISWYSYFIEKCEENFLDVKHFMDVMLCIDFLIANNDRHLNNFGILRNPVSLKWQKISPVFDSGNSLFYNSTANSNLPKGKELLKMQVNSFCKNAGEQMKYVSNRGCVDLNKLPSLNQLENIIRLDTSLSDFDLEQRLTVLSDLRKIFEDFQNGANIWNYKYQKGLL